ncbi:hypothetical protein [Herbaspirillum chlorophenolicum]|uniref:hypothetical protein n=1 Tax=Herbaspirillum chlorophenolicum TaxID=211589 RepID=UPI00067A770F|nr:hypothetical protein [Herbaspirillum chlorophenolicum]
MSEKKVRKPPVAETNKNNAKQNIVRKKNVLDAWAKNGIPFEAVDESNTKAVSGALDFFPRSIRQFNFWDGSENSEVVRSELPEIARNANDTLRSYPDLKSEVEKILDALIAREILQKNQSKPIKVKKLLDTNALEKKLRSILENELVNLRRQQADDRKKYNGDVASLTGQITELKGIVHDLKSENQGLSQQVRNLKSQIAKVSPLKGV